MAKVQSVGRIIKKKSGKGKAKKHPNKSESFKAYIGQGR